MKKFKSLLILSLFFVILFPHRPPSIYAQLNPRSELTEGFRDLKWGMPVSELPETYMEINVSKQLIERFHERDFVKKDMDVDHLTVSGILATQIRYIFFFDKFAGVSINFSYADRETVTKVMEERFGTNAKIEKKTDSTVHRWAGEKTMTYLTIHDKHKVVRFDILTREGLSETGTHQKQKEKEKEDQIKRLSKERF